MERPITIAPVAQASSLPSRGFPIRNVAGAAGQRRLPVGETADYHSAPPVAQAGSLPCREFPIRAFFAALLLSPSSLAQYAIPWYTIDGGDASTGGFWALPPSRSNTWRPNAHDCSRRPRLRHHLLVARHRYELGPAGAPEPDRWRVDQLAQRLDQPGHRPGHAAHKVLSAV